MTPESQNPEPEPKFRRRAEARPDEVLDAAVALFTAKGYGATSVEAIARRAGISKGAVYLYFPSKQAILEGLVDRALGPVSGEMLARATAPSGSVRDAISEVLMFIAHRLSRPGALAIPKIVIREAVVAPDIAGMYREHVLDAAIPALAMLIRRGVETGEFRKVDPEMTIRSVVGPVIAHAMLAEVFGLHPEGGLKMEQLVRNHLDILFGGLCSAERADYE